MSECLTPYYVQTINERHQPVPCGKCPQCIKRRVSGWSFRLMQQSKISSSAYFITLTYDTNHIPITRNGFMELKKRDLQLFFKRLRKNSPSTQGIKYYAVGEYGGRTMRPHYHVIMFGASIELIQPSWNLGNIHYGQVSEASVGYTLKYMAKPGKIPLHRNDDRQPEFSLMSKGLGLNYLTTQMVQWHKNDLDNRMYCTLNDGKKISMPRYYKDKLYTEMERKRVAYFARASQLAKVEKEMLEQGDEYHVNKMHIVHAQFKKQSYQSKNRDKL